MTPPPPAGGLLVCAGPLTASADDVADRFDRTAAGLGRAVTLPPAPPPGPWQWPTGLGQDLCVIADVCVWLDGLREDVDRIGGDRAPRTLSSANP